MAYDDGSEADSSEIGGSPADRHRPHPDLPGLPASALRTPDAPVARPGRPVEERSHPGRPAARAPRTGRALGPPPRRDVGRRTGPAPDEEFPTALKILIAGGFGVGKTTFVGAVSEIDPLSTEELLTQVSMATDRLDGVEDKTTTTVAMDFGRITLDDRHVLYLFGTPGQERFWFMWDELSKGALGAIVLADTRRLQDSFSAVDFFEGRGISFVVAVNEFDGAHRYDPDEVRAAIDLKPQVPIVMCDARISSSGIGTLVTLVHHLLTTTAATAPEPSYGAPT